MFEESEVGGRFEPVQKELAGIKFRGLSVAGRETYFAFPSLGLAFDFGRGPRDVLALGHIFLSHAHLDHSGGLAYWASQRKLLGLSAGRVYTEASAVGPLRRILELHEGLEGAKYHCRIDPILPGEPVLVRKDLAVRSFPAVHRIPALGFVVSEKKRKLVALWREQSGDEIRSAVLRGETVSEEVAIPLVAFSGDTSMGVFDTAPADFFKARILLLECSFVRQEDFPRAHHGGHLHLDDIAGKADLFENEFIVLTHLSLRAGADEIRREIQQRLPARLLGRVIPFLPETRP